MLITWIFLVAFFSLTLMLSYSPHSLPLTFAQPNFSSSFNSSFLFSGDRFANMEYPSFWERIEIPEINGVLFLSPLKTVGVIAQIITEKDIVSDQFYTDLILLMRQNLNDLNIISTNTTKNLIGSNIETVEYSYGNESKFRIQQTMETGKNQAYLFTFFSETIFYDRHIPIISTMKNNFLYLNENNKSLVKQPLSGADISGNDDSVLDMTKQMDMTSQNLDRNLIYNNPYLGITLEYPSTLIKKEGDNGVSFFRDQGNTGIILGVIPSSHDSLENFTSEHISNFESNLENFAVTNISRANLFNEPTALLFFKYENNSRLYEGMEYITMDGTDAYVFSYFSPSVTFDDDLTLFSNIIESIQLRNLPRIT
jgi:hypothetical protein